MCPLQMMIPLLVTLLTFSQVAAIKFSAEGVTVPEGQLTVNADAQLACRYIMWKQERLYSVTWSLRYKGVKTDFFVYKAGGNKDIKPGVSLVIVDEDASNDKVVTMRLTDGDEDEVRVCCDVNVLRDSGYGQMTTLQKEKCSGPISVVEPLRHRGRGRRIMVSLEAASEGRVGDRVPLVCTSTGTLTWAHRMQLLVNGVEMLNTDYRNPRLDFQLALEEEHFAPSRRGISPQRRDGQVTVECVVLEGRTVVANSTQVIRKIVSSLPMLRGGFDRGSRALYSQAQHQSHHRGLPCYSYLIVREKHGDGALILGRINGSILEQLTRPTPNGEDRYETADEPVVVLNILGFHGYRVVGVAKDTAMVWTLEKRNDEMHDEL